jgi:hypothetical protein
MRASFTGDVWDAAGASGASDTTDVLDASRRAMVDDLLEQLAALVTARRDSVLALDTVGPRGAAALRARLARIVHEQEILLTRLAAIFPSAASQGGASTRTIDPSLN